MYFADELRRVDGRMRVWRRSNLARIICGRGASAALIEGLVMPVRVGQTTLRRMLMMALITITPALLLVACQRETDTTASAARPIRTTTVEKRETGEPLTFTGRIEAAFRNCGTG
jgi:hypothetical protein